MCHIKGINWNKICSNLINYQKITSQKLLSNILNKISLFSLVFFYFNNWTLATPPSLQSANPLFLSLSVYFSFPSFFLSCLITALFFSQCSLSPLCLLGVWSPGAYTYRMMRMHLSHGRRQLGQIPDFFSFSILSCL